MRPEYASGHGGHVTCLRYFFAGSVRMGNDGVDALARTLAISRWLPRTTGMTSIETRDGSTDG
jgi:hypothetical protein